MLHSILIAPGDLQNDQIAMTVITHAEKKGMSVLRQGATDDEFRRILAARIRDASRRFHGVASVPCTEVRALTATAPGDFRQAGDRLYCVLDSDMEGLPNHADIFATVPRSDKPNDRRAAWRKARSRLMTLMAGDISPPQVFRQGALAPPP
jgi:hypothetical protein